MLVVLVMCVRVGGVCSDKNGGGMEFSRDMFREIFDF